MGGAVGGHSRLLLHGCVSLYQIIRNLPHFGFTPAGDSHGQRSGLPGRLQPFYNALCISAAADAHYKGPLRPLEIIPRVTAELIRRYRSGGRSRCPGKQKFRIHRRCQRGSVSNYDYRIHSCQPLIRCICPQAGGGKLLCSFPLFRFGKRKHQPFQPFVAGLNL